MRLPLEITPSFSSQLAVGSPSTSDPPLVFIDQEPFIVELQGKLDLPEGEHEQGGIADEASRLRGSRVGKIDLSDPKKPTMRIAHHRLEGKLETLLTPYALLRTSRRRRHESTTPDMEDEEGQDPDRARSTKRPRIESQETHTQDVGGTTSRKRASTENDDEEAGEGEEGTSTRIEIVGIIRKKIVFNKRPEPLIEISSEADPLSANSAEGRQEKEAKRGPKSLLGFGGGKR